MKQRLLILLAFFSIACSVRATHIIGGGFSLTCLHDSTYQLHLKVYRDCLNGQPPFNNPLYAGIFSKVDNNRVQIISMTLDSNKIISYDTNACFQSSVPLCSE